MKRRSRIKDYSIPETFRPQLRPLRPKSVPRLLGVVQSWVWSWKQCRRGLEPSPQRAEYQPPSRCRPKKRCYQRSSDRPSLCLARSGCDWNEPENKSMHRRRLMIDVALIVATAKSWLARYGAPLYEPRRNFSLGHSLPSWKGHNGASSVFLFSGVFCRPDATKAVCRRGVWTWRKPT